MLTLLFGCHEPPVVQGPGVLRVPVSAGLYRLSGTLAITDLEGRAVTTLTLAGGHDVQQTLPAGSYRWRLLPGWRMSTQRGRDLTRFASLRAAASGPLTVQPAVAQHLTLAFNLGREPVDFDPCKPHPDVAACTSWDSDHDSIANGAECPHGEDCADTDDDGVPDQRDGDSDGDGLADAVDVARLDACTPSRSNARCAPTKLAEN